MMENFPGGDVRARNKEIERQRKDEKNRERRDLLRLLKFPEFRRFYWRKLSESGVYSASFNLNSKLADFNEGKRDMGLVLLTELNNADANAFAQMQREAVSAASSKPQIGDSKDGE